MACDAVYRKRRLSELARPSGVLSCSPLWLSVHSPCSGNSLQRAVCVLGARPAGPASDSALQPLSQAPSLLCFSHLFPDYPGRQRRIQVHVGDHPAGTEAHHKIQSPRADGQAAHFPGPGPFSCYGSLHCEKAALSIFVRADNCRRLPFKLRCQDPAGLLSSGPAAGGPSSPGVQVLSRSDGDAPLRVLQAAAS